MCTFFSDTFCSIFQFILNYYTSLGFQGSIHIQNFAHLCAQICLRKQFVFRPELISPSQTMYTEFYARISVNMLGNAENYTKSQQLFYKYLYLSAQTDICRQNLKKSKFYSLQDVGLRRSFDFPTRAVLSAQPLCVQINLSKYPNCVSPPPTRGRPLQTHRRFGPVQ